MPINDMHLFGGALLRRIAKRKSLGSTWTYVHHTRTKEYYFLPTQYYLTVI